MTKSHKAKLRNQYNAMLIFYYSFIMMIRVCFFFLFSIPVVVKFTYLPGAVVSKCNKER